MHHTNKQFLPTTGGVPNASPRELLIQNALKSLCRIARSKAKIALRLSASNDLISPFRSAKETRIAS
jgi:hypothetical protein